MNILAVARSFFSFIVSIPHRQDALQRHWDKYCRKKSKRHLDKEAAETQTRTIPSVIPTPMYTPGAPPTQTTPITTTMGIGSVLDQVIILSSQKYQFKH